MVLLITCSPPRTCYDVCAVCGIFQRSKSLEKIWSALLQKFTLKYWPFKIRILKQSLVKLLPRDFYEFQFCDQILVYPHVFNFPREQVTVKKNVSGYSDWLVCCFFRRQWASEVSWISVQNREIWLIFEIFEFWCACNVQSKKFHEKLSKIPRSNLMKFLPFNYESYISWLMIVTQIWLWGVNIADISPPLSLDGTF